MFSWRDIEYLLYPELKKVAPHHRERALKQAKEEPFDFIEWAGMMLGLVLAVSITRYSAAGFGVLERIAAALANFAVAVPLIVVMLGPFLVRRTRRGLKRYLDGRS